MFIPSGNRTYNRPAQSDAVCVVTTAKTADIIMMLVYKKTVVKLLLQFICIFCIKIAMVHKLISTLLMKQRLFTKWRTFNL